MHCEREHWDVIVIGGGIAGLSAAALLAKGGLRTLLLERGASVGGRAGTRDERGFRLNQGPHALYARGELLALLHELGIAVSGRKPAVEGLALARGQVFALPAGPRSLLGTGLLTAGAKADLVLCMTSVARADAKRLRGTTVAAWIAGLTRCPAVRDVLLALVRVSTYADAPHIQDASAAASQMKRALRSGVLYVDGGWQAIADGLLRVATAAGAVLRREDARTIARADDGFAVRAGADTLRASQVLLALPPRDAAAMLEEGGLAPPAAWSTLVPVRAACLDVGLARLPRPGHRFALGIDRPHYFSVHSATADLAPEGQALIHLARYGGVPAGTAPRDVEQELEAVLDVLQPGWRDIVAVRRFLPAMVVTHALHLAGVPRVPVALPEHPGLWVAGDWVGDEGMLADASAASARRAAGGILATRTAPPARHAASLLPVGG